MKLGFTKQCVELELMSAENIGAESETNGEESEIRSEFRSERVEALSWTTSEAQGRSTQPSECAEV